jgi:hypothetical protein
MTTEEDSRSSSPEDSSRKNSSTRKTKKEQLLLSSQAFLFCSKMRESVKNSGSWLPVAIEEEEGFPVTSDDGVAGCFSCK